jgi:formate dehydrogenase iron-sulfur subunit
MELTRRSLFKFFGATGAAVSLNTGMAAARQSKAPPDAFGCLIDISRCIGCRKCELACNKVNDLPEPEKRFDDLTVLREFRRPDDTAFTVVNRYFTGKLNARNQPVLTNVKVQCMHCQDPACVSACITGALQKRANGAVTWDHSKCIGCRYCMIACPFQIPAYEYHDPLTPRVRKCTFCYERISKKNGVPGCAAICPTEAITFGKRKFLLELAHKRINEDPLNYMPNVYGEHEVGGTSWLYISKEPFEKLDSYNLPTKVIPKLTETIQHGIFNYMWAPLSLFVVLTVAMFTFNREQITGNSKTDHKEGG